MPGPQHKNYRPFMGNDARRRGRACPARNIKITAHSWAMTQGGGPGMPGPYIAK